MSDSVRPHRWQPTRLPHAWGSPDKNTGVSYHVLLQCMKGKVKVKLLSHVRLFETPWTAAYQDPPSMGFSRREHWSGCHLLLQVTTALFSMSVCLFLFGLVGSFILFCLFNSVLYVFHLGMKLYGVCLSLSDLFHLVQHPQGPSMLS